MEMDLSVQIVMDVSTFGAVWLDLAADHCVVMEVGMSLFQRSERVIVEQVRRVRHAHHQMNVRVDRSIWALQQIGDHASKRCDAGSSCKEQIVMSGRFGWKDESLSNRSGHQDFVPDLRVAEVVAADAGEQIMSGLIVLGCLRPVFIDETFAGRREDLSLTILSSSR